LQNEAELQEIVRLVGIDSLSASDRLTLETARIVREDFLQQNAFVDVDSYTPLEKQFQLLRLVLEFYDLGKRALAAGVPMQKVFDIKARERIGRAKDVPNDAYATAYAEISKLMNDEIEALIGAEVQE